MGKQINLTMPDDVLRELHDLIPAGERSNFIADMTRRGLRILKLKRAAEESFGAWKLSVHEELSEGTEAYIRSCREASRSIRESSRNG